MSLVAHLVAFFGTLNPRETEVSERAADGDRQTQIDVEGHEDEHQREADPQLDEVQQRLQQVHRTQHADSPVTHTAFPVASLGWVTPGAVTEGVRGVTPPFFPEKPGDLFFSRRFIAFCCFHSGVTPLEGVTLHLFNCPTSFLHYSL